MSSKRRKDKEKTLLTNESENDILRTSQNLEVEGMDNEMESIEIKLKRIYDRLNEIKEKMVESLGNPSLAKMARDMVISDLASEMAGIINELEGILTDKIMDEDAEEDDEN